MKNLKIILISSFLLFVTACNGSGAKDLYETAQFEELQNNHRHALQLYEEILRDYPEIEFAKKSGEKIIKLKEDGDG